MKNSVLKRKLDKQIQQERPEGYCEVCGCPAQVFHHFVQKRQSESLRYDPQNLIPLCASCHYKHHTLGDPEIVATIIRKRGQKWYKYIQENRHKIIKQDKAYFDKLEEMLSYPLPHLR